MAQDSKLGEVTKPTALILAGFSIVLLVLTAVTAIGLINTLSLSRQLRAVVEENTAKADFMQTMSDVIHKRMFIVFSIVTEEDPFLTESEWERFSGFAGQFINAREKLHEMGLNAKQTEQLEAQRDALSTAQVLTQQVFEFARQENYPKAREALVDARKANTHVLIELEEMRDFQRELAKGAVERAGLLYQNTRLQVLSLFALGVVVCLSIIVFIVHRIRTQQEALTAALNALHESNRTLESRVEQRSYELMAVQRENMRMGAELNVTRRLQRMLLPKDQELRSIESLDIAGFSEPADEVGGDYYDILNVNGRIKIGIGDITGHGLESGVIMLMLQTTVRALLEAGINEPKAFMKALNNTIYANVKRMGSDKNLTLALMDYHQGRLCICGQHEEILLVRRNREIERIDTIDLGFIIGLEQNIGNFLGKHEIQLEPGDGVVLYTDGITEAFNNDGEQYGVDRLCDVISEHWHASAYQIQQSVIADVHRHICGNQLMDDITLVVLKQRLPGKEAQSEAAASCD